MSESSEAKLLPAEAPNVTPMATATPMALLSMAVSQGAPLDQMERLMGLQERWEANEARKAFSVAFSNFKSEAVLIAKNITITDGPLKGKRYADLFAVVNAATPALSKYGLSASWKLTKDDPGWVEVACTLRHVDGHCETVTMGGPPDTGGAKNAIQARGSSVAYLERYTFLAITGLAASDQDKDGKAMPEPEFQGWMEKIKASKTLSDLQSIWNDSMAQAKDQPTKRALIDAKDARKIEIQKEAK